MILDAATERLLAPCTAPGRGRADEWAGPGEDDDDETPIGDPPDDDGGSEDDDDDDDDDDDEPLQLTAAFLAEALH